jgi:ABC-type transport system involved in multi-copper enzyme maturation permease subunit
VNTTSLGGGSSKGGPTLATGTFDQVSRQGAWPAARWTGQDLQGTMDPALSPSAQGFTQAGSRLAVSGSGDIAPATDNTDSVKHTLAGTFAGLIAVVVIGVMFITAEYRRGLIRTTLTASPRRGRVLAAKAVVLGAASFAAGLVAAVIVIPVGERLLHANGNPISPVTMLTWLQVVVGTAALLAVSAVLGLAVGTLLRRSAGAVTAVIVAIVLPYLLATVPGILPVGAAQWLLRVTPAAGFAVQQTLKQYPQVQTVYTPGTAYFPLSPWAGFAVLCAWAAVALALALFLLRRRDA